MPTPYATTDFLQLGGVTDVAGTLSWTGYGDGALATNVVDNNDDGNLDQAGDFWAVPTIEFSGYTVDFGGVTWAVFTDGTDYYIPYTKADVDLFGAFPFASSTSDFGDNAVAYPLCFAKGTEIDTPTGPRKVEDLRIGDPVCTASGEVVPVKWIGRQTYNKFVGGARMQPVRIRAGALGDGLPTKDLSVTADHGMIIDDLVINASALVNASTIDFVPMDELEMNTEFFHVETEAHDVILANGAPAETFIDYAGREAFDNYQEYLDLYGAERIIPEMARYRISDQRLLPEGLRQRFGISEPVYGSFANAV